MKVSAAAGPAAVMNIICKIDKMNSLQSEEVCTHELQERKGRSSP